MFYSTKHGFYATLKMIRTVILQLSGIGLAIALLMIWMLMTLGEGSDSVETAESAFPDVTTEVTK